MKQVSYQQDKDKLEMTVGGSKVVMTGSGLASSISVHDLELDSESFVTRDELESVLKRVETLELELASRTTQPK